MGTGGVLDHLPIYFDIKGRIEKPKGPFKFNLSWLKEASYLQMVKSFWQAHPLAAKGNIAEGFVSNLKEFKKLSKAWAHNKRVMDDRTLRETEVEIVAYENAIGGVFTSLDQKDKLQSLYAS